MKIYLVYKFSGVDKEILRKKIEVVSDSLEKLGHKTFAFFRDMNKWGEISMPIKETFENAFSEIKKSDAVFVIIDDNDKKEGMLLEIGFAKAMGKKIYLAIRNDVERFFALRAIADDIIEFDDIDDLEGLISKLII